MNPARLKAFVLDLGDGPDLEQAHAFLDRLGLSLFLEPIEADASALDVSETIRVIEDYKPLDIESATMAIALCRGIRERYPDWRYLIDGDGGDENLKDYPIEENPELTIRSVINNQMLYQEGWGVGKIKHSLTYSGGLSRSYTRTYAPAHHYGFKGFSPYTTPSVIAVAEAIPFIELTQLRRRAPLRTEGRDRVARRCGRHRTRRCRSFPSGASSTVRCPSTRCTRACPTAKPSIASSSCLSMSEPRRPACRLVSETLAPNATVDSRAAVPRAKRSIHSSPTPSLLKKNIRRREKSFPSPPSS